MGLQGVEGGWNWGDWRVPGRGRAGGLGVLAPSQPLSLLGVPTLLCGALGHPWMETRGWNPPRPPTAQPAQPQGAALGTNTAVGLSRGGTSTKGRLDPSRVTLGLTHVND